MGILVNSVSPIQNANGEIGSLGMRDINWESWRICDGNHLPQNSQCNLVKCSKTCPIINECKSML